MRAAFRILLFETKALGQARTHIVSAATFTNGLNSREQWKDSTHTTGGITVRADFCVLDSRDIGQQQISKAGAGSHMIIDDDNEFHLRLIPQDLGGLIDITVLAGKHIAGVADHKFDRVFQPFCTNNTVGFIGHLGTTNNGISPHKEWDLCRYRVFTNG